MIRRLAMLAPQQITFAHVAIAHLDILPAAAVAVAELALDLDIAPRFQLGILGVAGVDLPLGIELAEELPLIVTAANDAVTYRDAAPCLDPAPLDKAADDDVAADRDPHARVDVIIDDQPPFKGDMTMARIHPFDAEHLIHLHARFLLTG